MHLLDRPGELITKQALLDAIWPGVAVTEDVVRQSVGELREALGDERAAPRFIATVPRRGYRFVARLAAGEATPPEPPDPVVASSRELDGTVVGRVRERATIAGWLRAARSWRRQCLLADVALPGGRGRAAKQFERAMAIAAERKSLLFELRAATSLLRLGGKAARVHVSRLVGRFDADNDCTDARGARRLLGA